MLEPDRIAVPARYLDHSAALALDIGQIGNLSVQLFNVTPLGLWATVNNDIVNNSSEAKLSSD